MAFGCVTGLALGLPLTYSHGGARTSGYLAGAAGLSVVLIYLPVNLSVFRAFRTGFRAEFRVWRHLVIPAAAVVFFFRSGDPAPARRTLMDLLPFTALGRLGLGFIAAGVLRARRPAHFEALGRAFLPADDSRRLPRDIECGQGADGITRARVTTSLNGPAGWSHKFRRI